MRWNGRAFSERLASHLFAAHDQAVGRFQPLRQAPCKIWRDTGEDTVADVGRLAEPHE